MGVKGGIGEGREGGKGGMLLKSFILSLVQSRV